MRYAKIVVMALLAATLHFGSAFAAMEVPFEQAAFAKAQQEGKPILVDITASWCPTCAAQKPILDKLAAEPQFKDLIIFKLDYTTQRDAVRAMDARSQSTLVAFRGTVERARSVGDTDPDSIRALVEKTGG